MTATYTWSDILNIICALKIGVQILRDDEMNARKYDA